MQGMDEHHASTVSLVDVSVGVAKITKNRWCWLPKAQAMRTFRIDIQHDNQSFDQATRNAIFL